MRSSMSSTSCLVWSLHARFGESGLDALDRGLQLGTSRISRALQDRSHLGVLGTSHDPSCVRP